MLNREGVRKTSYAGPRQILANVEMQAAVGCIVDANIGVQVGSKKIVKAGTPISIDLMDRQTPVKAAASGAAMNAVLLHDVDVTDGNANGTALIFGFINVNRVEDDVAALITTATGLSGADAPSPLLVFMKG